jgi:hypothetical protein
MRPHEMDLDAMLKRLHLPTVRRLCRVSIDSTAISTASPHRSRTRLRPISERALLDGTMHRCRRSRTRRMSRPWTTPVDFRQKWGDIGSEV